MKGFIKFLGTGGARFVISSQLRATGGLWLNYGATNLYIDPGPGALVRIRNSRGHLDPANLDGIILTHKHLDHANDVNALIEAMTEGGFKKRGVLYCPADALNEDPVVFKYVRGYPASVETVAAGSSFTLKDVTFTFPVRHIHPVETYGVIFHLNKTVALITDTRFFEALPSHYRADMVIVNVLRSKPIEERHVIDHLSIHDVARIVKEIRPEVAVMTHFGMNIIREKPHLIARKLTRETGVKVLAARDGMVLPL